VTKKKSFSGSFDIFDQFEKFEVMCGCFPVFIFFFIIKHKNIPYITQKTFVSRPSPRS